jgi:hypothetical protein
MIAELISIISAGILAVEGVTRIIKNIQDIADNSSKAKLQQSVQYIQERVENVDNELAKQEPNPTQLIESYTALINAIQQDGNYSSRLKVIPTDHGTWKILRKKSTTLRDPQGEF